MERRVWREVVRSIVGCVREMGIDGGGMLDGVVFLVEMLGRLSWSCRYSG